jgi:hypothetical protein
MISIVLVLMLILGVNQVFKLTSDAVGAGQSMSTIGRDNRAAQSTIYNDFRVAVSPKAINKPNGDAPFLIIRSQREPAFRNQQDALADLDYSLADPTDALEVDRAMRSRDLNADNDEDWSNIFETPSVAIYDSRNHRVDRIGFFIRDLVTRQTGGDAADPEAGPFIAPMSSTEAYVWYGHLRQPDFGVPVTSKQRYEHRNPGIDALAAYVTSGPDPRTIQDNPTNFYATQWILGRAITLLVSGEDTNGDGVIDLVEDRSGIAQTFIQRRDPVEQTDGPDDVLTPLGSISQSSESVAANRYLVNWSRYDVAGTTFNDYSNVLKYYIADWPNPAGEQAWWEDIGGYRFQGNPYPPKPFDAPGLARTSPVFLRACSQFIVEYAGNFVAQDVDGNVTMDYRDPAFVDTEIDYVVDASGATPVKQTRWYGLPRNVNTSDDDPVNGPVIRGFDTGVTAEDMLDVVPLSDLLDSAGLVAPAPFERSVPDPKANYASLGDPMQPNIPYTVAWGPDTTADPMPTMLRITLAIDDPNGRLAEAQTFEYVIQLP